MPPRRARRMRYIEPLERLYCKPIYLGAAVSKIEMKLWTARTCDSKRYSKWLQGALVHINRLMLPENIMYSTSK